MNVTMEKIVSLCKRRGFVYPGSEIYGGLAGTYDYGPLGVELKRNIEQLWWKMFVKSRSDIFGLDSAIIMPAAVWKASGHLEGFSDAMVQCGKCKRRFRADQLDGSGKCPECGGGLEAPRAFNMMFKTQAGAAESEGAVYLRPEIAQGMFVNFKNVIDSYHPDLPFGIAQSGRAFRNEISPRDFLFRVREFDLMEFEYFVRPEEWERQFENWRKEMWAWIDAIGLDRSHVHELEVAPEDRAHYSKRTIDFEFDYPFGRKELYGLAYRTDYDLTNHQKASGADLSYLDEKSGTKFVPHVIEPTFGLGRTVLAILCDAYREDELGPSSAEALAGKGEKRVYLKLNRAIAPVKAAVFPLLKNKAELVAKARAVFGDLASKIPGIQFDDNGNIGKRYRRQDEIGTPFCVTIDFQTLEDDTVTIRERDSGEQRRVPSSELTAAIQ